MLALDETLPSAAAAAVDARLGSPLIERAVSAWQARRPVATVALPCGAAALTAGGLYRSF